MCNISIFSNKLINALNIQQRGERTKTEGKEGETKTRNLQGTSFFTSLQHTALYNSTRSILLERIISLFKKCKLWEYRSFPIEPYTLCIMMLYM